MSVIDQIATLPELQANACCRSEYTGLCANNCFHGRGVSSCMRDAGCCPTAAAHRPGSRSCLPTSSMIWGSVICRVLMRDVGWLNRFRMHAEMITQATSGRNEKNVRHQPFTAIPQISLTVSVTVFLLFKNSRPFIHAGFHGLFKSTYPTKTSMGYEISRNPFCFGALFFAIFTASLNMQRASPQAIADLQLANRQRSSVV